MADTFNDNLKTIGDKYDETYDSWVNNPDLKDEPKRRGARAATERAEELLAEDDRAFEAAIDEERRLHTGRVEALRENRAPPANDVGSMMGAKAAVDSGDAAIINAAYDDALRRKDESALVILERSGASAMPTDALRDKYKERVREAQEARKHPKIKEAEEERAASEERARKAEYARAMIRSNLVQRIRSRKGPGA